MSYHSLRRVWRLLNRCSSIWSTTCGTSSSWAPLCILGRQIQSEAVWVFLFSHHPSNVTDSFFKKPVRESCRRDLGVRRKLKVQQGSVLSELAVGRDIRPEWWFDPWQWSRWAGWRWQSRGLQWSGWLYHDRSDYKNDDQWWVWCWRLPHLRQEDQEDNKNNDDDEYDVEDCHT